MATNPVIKNQAAINAAAAAKRSAIAGATSALAAAKTQAPTRAGASILSQGGGADAARYTALAQKLGQFENLADSKLSTSALTKAEQDALTGAENITLPAAEYATANDISAYDMLQLELGNLGLSSLIEPLKALFQQGITDADTLRLKLSETPEYKTRFSANADRIKAGLRALSPAEYIKMEDSYQNLMRNYGLPATYYTKDATGKQAGFDQLLANDVSAVELEDRLATAQQRVLQSNPEVLKALKNFYGDTITNGDIMAYTLDPKNALTDIKRKVTAAEIQGAAEMAGLNKITQEATPEFIRQQAARAQELAGYGVDKAKAIEGFQTVADIAPRGSQLAAIYNESPYTQATAEQEVFNLAGSAEATKKRKKLTELEKATFSGSAGTASGALSRDRAYQAQSYREPGAGAY